MAPIVAFLRAEPYGGRAQGLVSAHVNGLVRAQGNRMIHRLRLVSALVIASAVGLGACGGSKPPPKSTTTIQTTTTTTTDTGNDTSTDTKVTTTEQPDGSSTVKTTETTNTKTPAGTGTPAPSK